LAVVWKNETARVRLEGWYERFLARIPAPVLHREVPTRFGSSHVLLAGPDDAPPLVCLHAMRTGAAHFVSELTPLIGRFCLIAPDLPGQSVRGLPVRLPFDDSNARWLADVLDGLGLDRVNLLGVSWGGYVARLMANTFPDRINRLALLVPAGIVNGSHWKGLTRMALPLLRYRLWRTDANLRRFLDPLLTTWDEDWAHFMADSLDDMPIDMRIPPLATDEQVKALTMPTLVLGAADDISFPGRPMVERINALLPHAETEIIPDCKHCPPTTPEFRNWLAQRLSRFFA
jgi:2-hydroxy-6-oxonona-2,4-dienedioate hydrolase